MEGFYSFVPELTRQPDFDRFWEQTLDNVKKVPLNLRIKRLDYPLSYAEVYEIIFNGYDDSDIYGFVLKPRFAYGKLPVLFHYHGFGGNCGSPFEFMHFAGIGISVVSIDIRGQSGRSKDNADRSGLPVNCDGLLNKDDYYYRRVYGDCIKVLDITRSFDFMDENRMIIEGVSQGGGITMAVAALDQRPKLALADIPGNSYYEGRFKAPNGQMTHIVDFIKNHPGSYEEVMKTLSYFDTMNLAERITCPVLASVGLKDSVCPPDTYFASYNRITSLKEIQTYSVGHTVTTAHTEYKLKYIKDHTGPLINKIVPAGLKQSDCKLIAHRGLSGIAPENTLEAFLKAATTGGYYGIETDIHLSKDGDFIISHDNNLKRMTGQDVFIQYATTAEIKNLDIIYGNNRSFYQNEIKTPLLNELLSLCEAYCLVPVIELKEIGQTEKLDELVQLIGKYSLPDCIIISFNLDYLIYLRSRYPKLNMQYLTWVINEVVIDRCVKYRLDVDAQYERLEPGAIELCHQNRLKVNLFTIDSPAAAQTCANQGTDFITTNILYNKE